MSEYQVTPLGTLGAEITDLAVSEPQSKETIQQLISHLHEHRVLVLRNQGVLTPEQLIRVGKWFGKLASDENAYLNHPKAPSKYVGRLSNDPSEGQTGIGTTGWHIDGSFLPKPFAVSVYHMVALPSLPTSTRFLGLKELVEGEREREGEGGGEGRAERWGRLWTVRCGKFRWQQTTHPLVYPHPDTSHPTMCYHLGKTNRFVWDKGRGKAERKTKKDETEALLSEIRHTIRDSEQYVYSHIWRPGDVILSDNLAVAHEAGKEAQLSRAEAGLRVLHRVNVCGSHRPKK